MQALAAAPSLQTLASSTSGSLSESLPDQTISDILRRPASAPTAALLQQTQLPTGLQPALDEPHQAAMQLPRHLQAATLQQSRDGASQVMHKYGTNKFSIMCVILPALTSSGQ